MAHTAPKDQATTNHAGLRAWVEGIAAVTLPDDIHWCDGSAEEYDQLAQALIDAGYTPEEVKTVKIYHGKGCTTCNKGGYKGRTGLYEVMEVTDELRELILVGASALELKKKAVELGMITLRRSGLTKIAAGLTTMEEVLRETVL